MSNTRIRTLNFLPEIFQTPTNAEFLSATLDQIVNPPVTSKIQGYIGSKFGYGVDAKDSYVTEPNKVRTDYQLEPGVVFLKEGTQKANDFISYPGMLDALKLEGGVTENNDRLFNSQFYSWDSFANLDKIINFNQYYWLPEGPPRVTVGSASVFTTNEYVVNSLPNTYEIREQNSTVGSQNPTLTLLRGGTYQFTVNQDSQFFIQAEPGVSGVSSTQQNLSTRDVLGVTNNGATQGVVTFTVPPKDAQNDLELPGNNSVDLISTSLFSEINGKRLVDLENIDGVTSLNGLRVMFFNTGDPDEKGYVSTFYDETPYDVNAGGIFSTPKTLTIASSDATSDEFTLASGTTDELVVGQTVTFDEPIIGGVTAGQVYYVYDITSANTFQIATVLDADSPLSLTTGSGSMVANINQGLFEEGFESTVSENFYKIQYVGDPADPVIRLVPDGAIPSEQKITARFGAEFAGRDFFKNQLGFITAIPLLTAPLDVLYYQDGSSPSKVGIIRLVESNATSVLDVEEDILGKKEYTSTNGVEFTNGLKVSFDGDVSPARFSEGEYYVEGVGTSIELVPVNSLLSPEGFTRSEPVPWDSAPYDIGNFDFNLFIPTQQDYITIARNAINKNAWSRSNRWFHIDVINASATYNNNPNIVTELATTSAKAKRPIIEFYPNLKLFNSGTEGKDLVDFIDNRTTDALSEVAGKTEYYPDIDVYSKSTGTIASVSGDTSTTLTINTADITGTLIEGMNIKDSDNVLPNNSVVSDISTSGLVTTITISWDATDTFSSVSDISFVASAISLDGYALFPESRIIFAADENPDVKDKIYVVDFSVVEESTQPVITLAEADDSEVLADNQVAILRGFRNEGKSYYYTGTEWQQAQQKTNVNQEPLFDVLDSNGVSFGDSSVYNGTSFAGCTLFSYGRGPGIDDPVLNFPIRYSATENVGDISFDITLNSDTFDYTEGNNPETQNVNTGYVFNYTSRTEFTRELGWKTAVAPSTQYQVFSFDFDTTQTQATFICDVPMLDELPEDSKGWPRVKVYVNNVWQNPDSYTVSVDDKSTAITLANKPQEDTVVQILLLSDHVSSEAYYEVPVNLNNNPFNDNLDTVNIGDIRTQYQDIFVNTPNTQGEIFGSNNIRDLGDVVGYGSKIIKNSASLALPGAFLRKNNHNLFDALLFNSREYVKFKQLLVSTINKLDFEQRFTPSAILDEALEEITLAKDQMQAFFWSDMLPSKAPFRQNTYTFNNDLDLATYPLTKVYDFEKANYDSVLVYLLRTENGIRTEQQLTINKDYIVSKDEPSLTVLIGLEANDQIVIKEYNQTYGSFVPNTPTKLGLYPASEPGVVLDKNYSTQPAYFIKGHDGSYTKLYGTYDPDTDTLVDFRDQALLEFEKRVYNNLKLSGSPILNKYDVVPGFFRDVGYDWNEFLEIYSSNFLNWIGQNRLDYRTQLFNKTDENTYNYSNTTNQVNGELIPQGYWRGVYEFFYDTSTPNQTPWEMLGFANQPDWWTERYGPAPYTSDNKILWDDLEAGFIWNNGDSYVEPNLARPGLSEIIPVDSNGEIKTAFQAIVKNYSAGTFQRDWRVGDAGPVEFSYQRSSSYPFDLVKIFALTKPAEFFNLAVDLDNYKFNEEFNQYLINDRSYLDINNIEIYGTGTPKTSYINWIVDFEKQLGISATQEIDNLLDNLDVRLVYRLAGYSDKTLLQFFVEKGTPNSTNASLLLPDESYSVLLYDNQAFDRIEFSSVIIQKVSDGWQVYGNGQNLTYFRTLEPIFNNNTNVINVEDLTVRVAKDYQSKERLVPYGTKFFSIQEVAQFLMNYASWLKSKGMIFDEVENGTELNWKLMISEYMYWAQSGWENGSVITLNPAAKTLKIEKESAIVQPLTLQQSNFILNQNLYPIDLNNLSVTREGVKFETKSLNQGDSMSYAQFDLSNFEHGVVFDNVTVFNDVIYNLKTGLRQSRINVRGTKTAEWDGTVNAYGFILNQDNIEEWSREKRYAKGQIVLFKNRYWSALKVIQPSATFNENDWKRVDYEDIQKGMLPNASTRAFESTLYYDVNEANLEKDSDLLGYSLIGYRPKDYLSLADLTDVTQVNVYKNLIENKGTRNAVEAFKGVNLPQGGIDYELYENWAIKTGDFGGVLNDNYVEFKLNQRRLTGNPAIFSLTNGKGTSGSQQEIPLYSLYDYGRVIDDPNVLSTIDQNKYPVNLFADAGFVNLEDVKMASYFYSGLSNAVDKDGVRVPIQDFYVGDYVWIANFKDHWGVFSWKPAGLITEVSNNVNGTATVTFEEPHELKRLESLSIVNFSPAVDGYYIISNVVDRFTVTINLAIPEANEPIQSTGIGLALQSQRVEQPGDIENLNLLETEFTKNVVWVDEDTDGEWSVYKKSINYDYLDRLARNESSRFGFAVAYGERLGYLASDPLQGKVYRYSYRNDQFTPHPQSELTKDATFGTSIEYANDIYAISEPKSSGDGKVYLYVINDTVLSDELIDYQEIQAPAEVTGEWGSELAFSGDNRWLYVSAKDDNKVYVYRQQNILLESNFLEANNVYKIVEVGDTDWESIGAVEAKEGIYFIASGNVSGTGVAMQVNYELVNIIDGSGFSKSDDQFGSAVSTNNKGAVVAISAPQKDFNNTIQNWGAAYIYERTMQNFESKFGSGTENITQSFNLAWQPETIAVNVTETNETTNKITLNDVTGIAVNDPVIFSGSGLLDTGINSTRVYYVESIAGNDITIKQSRSTTDVVSVNSKDPITDAIVSVQTSPLYVSVNGLDVADNNYAVIGNTLIYTGPLRAGDLVNVSGSKFAKLNTFNSDFSNRTNIEFGYDVAVSNFGNEILVGSPLEIDDQGVQGAAYRFTNGGASYGVVMGTNECNLTSNKNILINGFLVQLAPGDAQSVARQINRANIPNIQASFVDNKLMIEVVDFSLALICEKLCVTSYDVSALEELGISVFTKTQTIQAPHKSGITRFGNTIDFNESDSVVISAPVGTRYTGTSFDFSDDLDLENDTIFDNNATRFIDEKPNVGAVYMYDYLPNYNENVMNPGKYIYAQSVNSKDLSPGNQPLYGTALDFNKDQIVIGSPDFKPNTAGGEIVVYTNPSKTKNWELFRRSAPIVNIEKVQNAQLFSAETNDTLINLDYIDPLQGKLLGAVRENIDYISNVDPASYNSDSSIADQTGFTWGQAHVGEIWFNTDNVRWLNYHQNDPAYNAKYWGQVFPGSNVEVYTWVESNSEPTNYQGPGTPFNTNLFTVSSKVDSSGVINPVYYFWVRNTGVVRKENNKTLADITIRDYITNPKQSGIAYVATILPNAFALYNSYNFLDGTDSVFHIGFSNGTTSDIAHEEYSLIREDFVDDFLPGLPRSGSNNDPEGLYDRLLDSLSGVDETGAVVPNPFLPKSKQSGILARPRQSFFFNRLDALKNYLLYANEVLKEYPIAEIRQNASFLFASGEYFDTTDFWEYVNWWADGFDDSVKSAVQVPSYSDLATLDVSIGTLVTVEQNGDGKFEVYRYDDNGVWSRIGLENGTIQFKTFLWNFSEAKIGFGDNFFDTTSFDEFPSEETRNIVRALNEQIYIEDLAIHRNKSLILLFEYVQSETAESQNFLPWLNKTSLADVLHTIRELKPIAVFKEDNQEFLEGYINEVKPYHVVIKEFLFNYTGEETFEGNVTDFDLPPKYDPATEQFITPQLVNQLPDNEYQYTSDSPIWGDKDYQEWFANKGVAITGEPDFEITTLTSFLNIRSRTITVDNAQGFPFNGVIKIGDEQIAYTFVNRETNTIGGLTRGVNDTEVVDHIPGEQIVIDLPPVVVLNGGKGYSNPPRVTAFIDESIYPAPTKPAVLEAVMSLDTVIQINVIDPGQGYSVLPEIRVEPASTIVFENTAVDSQLHTIRVTGSSLATGDLVQYFDSNNGENVGRLDSGKWYYVNVLESSPVTTISLHQRFSDAVNNRDRIKVFDNGEGDSFKLQIGAKASAITTATPIRENKTKLRFDRTTYRSQIQDWRAGVYYGSFFAGNYFNSENVTSSSIDLQAVQPPIDTILASAQGAAFEIKNVENERQLTFSSFIRKVEKTNSLDNSITLIPQGDYSPSELETASGTTIGFYVDMPIKFVGAVAGGLIEEQTYYVAEIINFTDFTVSEEPGGSVVTLTDATIGAQGLDCLAGEVVDTAILKVNYPGILEVTNTQETTNVLTVPISEIGTGGTRGFYPGLPIFFTGDVFGGVIENLNYVITTVIDDERFTMSEEDNAETAQVSQTVGSNNTVVVDSTSGFSVNDPIIFNNMIVSDSPVTDFGNIDSGETYYVKEIVSSTEFTISTRVNGNTVTLDNETGSAVVTNQKDTFELSTATGSMTMNVSLPVSPGQVDGQLFTLYNTSEQFPEITPEINNDLLINRTVNATVGPVDFVALEIETGGTDNMYINLPIKFDKDIGNLSAGTTYYVIEHSGEQIPDPENPGETIPRPNIQTEVTSTTAGNNLICDDTSELYEGMGIVFSGSGLSSIIIGQEYFVKTIVDSTTFTLSDTPGGAEKDLEADSGFMLGTGDPYIKVSETPEGSAVDLSTEVGDINDPTVLTQFVETEPEFSISYILGGYRAIITEAGSGLAIGNELSVSGSLIGGTTPRNDLTMIVDEIDGDGAVLDVICSGTVPETPDQYYLKVRSDDELEVYSNALMTIPVSGIDFNYTGFASTTVTNLDLDNTITVTDVSDFEVNDFVVFTGEVSQLTKGLTYYIIEVDESLGKIKVSTEPSGSAVSLSSSPVNFTMSKVGSIAFLPEPFFFNQSIVRFNNRLYVCIISNDDEEFVFGKWELLDQADRRLNALDRTIGYYKPTDNMPGVDVTQLFDGVTYPNSTYLGNPFAPADQLTLDTVLQPEPFYPTGVDVTSVVWNGTHYLASANSNEYSAVVGSEAGETWAIARVARVDVDVTDLIFEDDVYLMTSTNNATPIYKSTDGISWSVILPSESMSLQSIAYGDDKWIAVGDSIVLSTDSDVWSRVFTFDPEKSIELFGINYVSIPAFTGFIAVGKGKREDFSTGSLQLVDTNIIVRSFGDTGEFWGQIPSLTPNGLYGVASNGDIIVAVGEEGVVYRSDNGEDWLGVNEVGVIGVNSNTDILTVTDTTGFNVDDVVRFTDSFGGLTAGTDYYIVSINTSKQLELSESQGGSVVDLTDTAIPEQTRMFAYDSTDPNPSTLRDLIYENNIWVAVGDNGTIKTSTDYFTWAKKSTGTTEDLTGVTYNPDDETFVAVGKNNTVLLSTDDGNTWELSNEFTIAPTIYTVKGDDFPEGYGPEELVSGVVNDNFQMSVTTRPGTNWPVVEYSHKGYGVVSVELTPEAASQTEYSFDNLVQHPAELTVQILDSDTKLGTTLNPNEYTIDWVNKLVILNEPIAFSPERETLRIDVYEVGNGEQLVKSSTDVDPIRTQEVSGFNEIYLSANYSDNIFNGGGLIRPETFVIAVEATETEALTDRITVDDTSKFTINEQVTFEGAVFGGLVEGKEYYVKTVNPETSTISVSETFNSTTGVAGPTFELTDASGSMTIKLQIGSGIYWTDPIVYRNGNKLVPGKTNIITRTRSSNNTVVTNATGGLAVGMPITFCAACPFGESGIDPLTTYYVHSIVNDREFTLSDTPGGPIKQLLDATGTTRFITNDYAIGLQPNGIQAELIFPTGTYSNDTDYIVYSLFGESSPEQYGYTLPETQYFVGNGASSAFNLTNNVTLDNPENAIVEINGLRQTISSYNIDPDAETITFTSPPDVDAEISVTSFNDTRQQYFNTQYGITGTPGSAFVTIEVTQTINTTGTFDQDDPVVQSYDQDDPVLVTYDENLNSIIVSDTSSLVVNDTIVFSSGTEFGGLELGKTYYVVEILSSTELVISEQVGGTPVQLTNDTGSMFATANGITVSSIVDIDNDIKPLIWTTRATEIDGDSIVVNSVTGIEGLDGPTVLFRPVAETTLNASESYSIGVVGDTDWNAIAGTTGVVYNVGDIITPGSTVTITGTGVAYPTEGFGGIKTDGTIYFLEEVDDVNNTIKIKDQFGNTVTFTDGATGDLIVEFGGQPAIRITTSTEHLFDTNTLLRISGTEGSVQLNDNVYYARVIDDFTFDLYDARYSPGALSINQPVTDSSSYTGGGFAWRAGTFYLSNAVASETEASENKIIVDSVDGLVIGTPVYFSQVGSQPGDTLIGGIEQGVEYYIKEIDSTDNSITISSVQFGDVLPLTSGTGVMTVTQWQQVNVDRLWVTVNGLRVPSSKLRLNDDGELSILTEIQPGDEAIITSMINYASPNQTKYINIVNQDQEAEVYRANADTTTWLEEEVTELSTQLKVGDLSKITNTVVDNKVVPTIDNGFYYIPISADKRNISGVEVVNNTTGNTISESNYKVIIVDTLPTVEIVDGSYISEGDELTITTLEGNIIIVNGEQIGFNSINFETNTLSQLQRGLNGTAIQPTIPKYTDVYGLLSKNRLAVAFYNQTWNSDVFDTEQGDPLQISQTVPAQFLRTAF